MNYSIFFFLLVAATAVSPSLLGQTSAKPGPLPPPARGIARLHITPAPGQVPTTLKELVDKSSLIIEGTVIKTLPPRETSPGSLETDAIISVTRTLKGVTATPQIAVAQRGGTTPVFTSVPAQYSLFQVGGDYLLFLIDDKRGTAPDIVGTKRYLVTGIWSGNFHFQDGRLELKIDEPDSLRKNYVGQTREQVIAAVVAIIRQ